MSSAALTVEGRLQKTFGFAESVVDFVENTASRRGSGEEISVYHQHGRKAVGFWGHQHYCCVFRVGFGCGVLGKFIFFLTYLAQ